MYEPLKIAVSLNLDRGIKRYNLMFRGIQEYVNKHANWTLFWDHFPEMKLKKSQPGRPAYDAVIGRVKYSAYDEIKRLGIPCVNLWYNSSLTEELPSCLVDFNECGKLAAQHLLNRGFKNIINVDFGSDQSSLDFLDGVREVLRPHKYNVKKYRFNRTCADSPTAWEKQMQTFQKWVQDWEFPLAICSSAHIISIITLCQQNGIRIPEDVAFVISGNEEGFCETLEPHITSVDTDYQYQGFEAARMLDDLLKGRQLEDKHVYINPKGVIARASTDTYATEDLVVRDALRFIADNIDKGIYVGDIVNHVPVSRSSLEIRFKAATGHTIKDEIDRLRIISAKRLLADEQTKIKSVFSKVGFSSPLHMRRVFQKMTGMTPGDYRNSLKRA